MSDNTPETQTLASAAAFAYARRSMCSDAAPAALAVTGSWHAEQPATASAHAAAKALAEAWAKVTALARQRCAVAIAFAEADAQAVAEVRATYHAAV
jgi:hypothetical protein